MGTPYVQHIMRTDLPKCKVLHDTEAPRFPASKATLPDSPGRKPSGIPSAATSVAVPRSVPAFLPRRISVGPRFFGKVREKRQRRERKKGYY